MLTTVFLVVCIFNWVQCDQVLFEEGFVKYTKRGQRHELENIKHVDGGVVDEDKGIIYVKSRRMPLLYQEAVRNLQNLRHLSMIRCRINEIKERAFFNLPSLVSIHLQDNEITEIRSGVFNGLPIKYLTLQRNQIKIIDSKAFDDMPNLYRIHLNANRLQVWDSAWFKNSPMVTEIYVRRNRLNHLPPRAFANIKGSHLVGGKLVADTKLLLSKNKLGKLDPASFDGLIKLSQLYLDRNQIGEVLDNTFRDLEEIDVIFLARNRIQNISDEAFPKVKKIGILDLSSNVLECLPYRLVTVANYTDLEKNDGMCKCIRRYLSKLVKENRTVEITYNRDACESDISEQMV